MSRLPARWGIRDGRPSPRDAALLAEVVAAVRGRLATLPEGLPAAPDTASSPDPADPDAENALTPQVQQLISAAVNELQRFDPYHPGSVAAPVLGGGVVSELLRRRQGAPALPNPDERHIDTRR